jgi:hypothetical protein
MHTNNHRQIQPKELFMKKARALMTALAGAGFVAAFLAGCGKNTSTTAETTAAPAANVVTPAEKNSFNEVTSHLDAGGNFYMYLGTEQILNGLSGKMASWRGVISSLPNVKDQDRDNLMHAFDLVTNLIKDSGIEDVSGFGVSSVEIETNFYRTKTVLHHYKGRGDGWIWTAFGTKPHDLDDVSLLPASTVFAAFNDLDAQQVWSGLEKDLTDADITGVADGIAKVKDGFEKGTGLRLDDVLGSLSGGFGIIITLNDDKIVDLPGGPGGSMKIPDPGILIAAKVKDDLIFNRLEMAMTNTRMAVAKTDKDGLKMRTLSVPFPIPITLRPSIARSGDYLFLATSDTLIEQCLAVKNGKDPGLKATDQFKKLAANVPAQGNRFVYVSKRLGQTTQDIQQQVADRASMRNPAAGELMQKVTSLFPPYDLYAVAANTDEGWMQTMNGSLDYSKLVVMSAMAVPAVAAGMVLPALAKAKAKAQEATCRSNLRQIQIAKQRWARENNKTSSDTPTWDDLAPYLSQRTIMNCPSSGTYSINSVGEQPTCSVHSHGSDN